MNSTGAPEALSLLSKGSTADYVDAFECAALPHLENVHRTARHLVGDDSWAKDLTQEVFLQAWKSFDRFQPGTNCKAWLMTILFHICQHHRRRMWRTQTVSWGPEHDELVASLPAVSSHLIDRKLIQALNTLPAWYKTVLILAEVYEYSYSEISKILKIPIGTVMSRLSRAKQQMRETMVVPAVTISDLGKVNAGGSRKSGRVGASAQTQ